MSNLHESIYYFQKILLSSLRAYWMFLNMFVSKSPCCHKIFIFSELLHNLILIKWNMVGKNNELFSERRERRFSMESENRSEVWSYHCFWVRYICSMFPCQENSFFWQDYLELFNWRNWTARISYKTNETKTCGRYKFTTHCYTVSK